MKRLRLLWVAPLVLVAPLFAEKTPSDLKTLCRVEADRVQQLFQHLDTERPELSAVREALQAGQTEEACRRLLTYYGQSTRAAECFSLGQMPEPANEAEVAAMLTDEFTFQGVKARPPHRADGGLDWSWVGPKGDPEWALMLNRHQYFLDLARAYPRTGQVAYLHKVTELLNDWILHNPPPRRAVLTPIWRAMEAGRRLADIWPYIFYTQIREPEFSDATKILMLASIYEHAEVCRQYHAASGNHLLVEMQGLISAAYFWPEFKASPQWWQEGLTTLARELERQVYPDGAQKELSNYYQVATLTTLERLDELARRGGQPRPALLEQRVEAMRRYVAAVAKPSGEGPLNNDGDVTQNLPASADAPPAASTYFPYAGQAILRGPGDRDAMWTFFDVGPAGLAHQHRDRLHVSLTAFGRDFLVDNGRYHYTGDAWRGYFTGTASHNVMHPVGQNQRWGFATTEQPVPALTHFEERYAFVLGEHRGGYSGESERVEQRRAVLSWFGQFWLIVDEFAAYGPRELETLWHFPPTTQVRLSSDRIFTDDPGRPNLLLLPAQPERGHLDLVRGQSKPEIQGWFSPRYNEKQSAIVARFRQSIHHPVVQAWLLIPSKTQSLGGEIQALPSQAGTSRVKVRVPGQPDRIIRIDFTAKTVEQALQVEEAPTALTWNDGPRPGGDDGKN